MSGVQKCEWELVKVDDCATNPGLASRWFGMDEAAIEAAAGRFKKGRNAGKLRGWVVYRKVRIGGWCYGIGGVLRPGMIFAHFCPTWDEMQDTAYGPHSIEEFLAGATRVDTCYGHDPAQARADRAAKEAAFQAEAAERERLAADESLWVRRAEDMISDVMLGSPAWDGAETPVRNAVRRTMAGAMAKVPLEKWDEVLKWIADTGPACFRPMVQPSDAA